MNWCWCLGKMCWLEPSWPCPAEKARLETEPVWWSAEGLSALEPLTAERHRHGSYHQHTPVCLRPHLQQTTSKTAKGPYHNVCRLQLGVSNPLQRCSMPASPRSLLFNFSSVRDGFIRITEERSSQLRLERLQSSILKEKSEGALQSLGMPCSPQLERFPRRHVDDLLLCSP